MRKEEQIKDMIEEFMHMREDSRRIDPTWWQISYFSGAIKALRWVLEIESIAEPERAIVKEE